MMVEINNEKDNFASRVPGVEIRDAKLHVKNDDHREMCIKGKNRSFPSSAFALQRPVRAQRVAEEHRLISMVNLWER